MAKDKGRSNGFGRYESGMDADHPAGKVKTDAYMIGRHKMPRTTTSKAKKPMNGPK